MIRVCIVDDHAIVRRGLKQILSGTKDMALAEEATDGEELLEKARRKKWDVTLLDLSMPGRGGLDVLKQFKSEYPKRPVIVLTMHSEDQYAVRVFRAGADGYLTKESVPDKLIDAIRLVASGRKYISPHIAEKLAWEVGACKGKLPHENLSDREYQVMCMLAAGKTVSMIADELSLSVKTISTNRTRILGKMSMKNNAEIISYGMAHKLVF